MIYLTSVIEKPAVNDSRQLDVWLERLAEKDPDALEDLYHHTKTAVYGFALSILKNPQDAEDVLHDCYIQVYSAAPGYRSQGKPLAWILTIAKNLCRMKLRERGKLQDVPQEEWEFHLDFRAETSPEDRLALEQCLNRLSDEERQIVVLHAVTGLKHREIAAMLELPLPTVLSKYHRAIKKLKQLLKKEDGNDET